MDPIGLNVPSQLDGCPGLTPPRRPQDTLGARSAGRCRLAGAGASATLESGPADAAGGDVMPEDGGWRRSWEVFLFFTRSMMMTMTMTVFFYDDDDDDDDDDDEFDDDEFDDKFNDYDVHLDHSMLIDMNK